MSFSLKDRAPVAYHKGIKTPRVYPLEDTDQYQSRISFQVMKVIPPRFNTTFKSVQVEGTDPALAPQFEKVETGLGGLSGVDVKAVPDQKVDLYLPISFLVQDRAEYNTSSLGLAGGATSAGLSSGVSVPGSVFQGIKQAGQSFAELFKGLAGQEITGLGAARIAQAIPTQGLRDALSLSAKVVVNPNVRTVFGGVAVRDFAFQFQFQPKSGRESVAVKNIIKLFRYHLYPYEIPGDFEGISIPLGFEYPYMFKIKLLSGKERPFKNIGSPIKLSYLRSVSASYNNQSSALHEDGAPTDINLNLSFIEYKTLAKQDIENEEYDTFYDHEYSQREANPNDFAPPGAIT